MKPCWAQYLFLAVLILLTGLSLTACGQKGPLYLPDESQSTQEK